MALSTPSQNVAVNRSGSVAIKLWESQRHIQMR